MLAHSTSVRSLLRAAAAAVIALTASPGWAAVSACLFDESDEPLRRVWVEHGSVNRMTNTSGCVTFGEAKGEIEVRVYAHNPVVRVDDGKTFAHPVYQTLRIRDGGRFNIADQGEFFRLAEDLRVTYEEGLREFSPWRDEFPAGTTRTSDRTLRVVWPDQSLSEVAFVEPAAVPAFFPLVHLKEGEESMKKRHTHELGHALHFSRLSLGKRVDLGIGYLEFLATDPTGSHCFERRTNRLVAWVEAFGDFAQFYGKAVKGLTTDSERHAAFYEEVEDEWRDRLTEPKNGCEDREDGPMYGEDVEGAIFMTLFYDYARKLGLDFVVTSVVECDVLDVRGYGECMRNRHGASSVAYQELVASGDAYGIVFSAEVAGEVEADDRFGSVLARGDFNGDRYADLAIGVPREDVGEVGDAGAVQVLYGTVNGLIVGRNQLWHLGSPSVPGQPSAGDLFGSALAAGDFDGDGYDDLAIGVPGRDIDAIEDAGWVVVLYGTRFGLDGERSAEWHQDSPNVDDVSEPGDRFGASLAAGRFDKDSFVDLAIGAPAEDPYAVVDAGQVTVIYGFASGLGGSSRVDVWNADSPGILGEAEALANYGAALAAGDLDGDGADDLAVGAPRATAGTTDDAGAVNVLYGDPVFGLIPRDNRLWTQDSPEVDGTAAGGDQFGASLATGDFDADGRDDLTVGIPSKDVGTAANTGAVIVIYGSAARFASARNELWMQGSGIADVPEAGDAFGSSVAAGDVDGDGCDDLAIGSPLENVGTVVDAGAVTLIHGRRSQMISAGGRSWLIPGGLHNAGNQFYSQASEGIPGDTEASDRFGWAVVAADFDKDGSDDLAIGVPLEDIETSANAGVVNVIRGPIDGGAPTDPQIWHQDR
jgi:hypothetical protein